VVTATSRKLGATQRELMTAVDGAELRGDDVGVAADAVVLAPHQPLRAGRRASLCTAFFSVPTGVLGRVGVRLLPRLARGLYAVVADELALQPDDVLLDVGCGSAQLLADHAGQARHVAGLDASPLQRRPGARWRSADVVASSARVTRPSGSRSAPAPG
jgi:SAM-dependent methyltransferase